ncbi:MAG: GlsB/YeaQ/YmgE family stress response membrane protein [Chloroflexi bacterium]|nr:GlsB/YeaQ/YmgE family stress response membrane protein [Chloroflexota bacterium]
MPELGIFGWIIIGLLAGAIAGAFVPGRQRYGCLGTMAIGIIGGLLGGFLWVNVLDQNEASGWLGALVIATLGSVLVILVLRAVSGRRSG